MCQKKIILLSGKKFSGKDTVADYLVLKYGYTKIAISSKIKDLLKLLFNFTDEQLNSNLKEVKDQFWRITPRKVLQFVGTEMFQFKIQELVPHIKRNFWITAVIDMIRKTNIKKLVITDIRFKHEKIELNKIFNNKNNKILSIKILRNYIFTSSNQNIKEKENMLNNKFKKLNLNNSIMMNKAIKYKIKNIIKLLFNFTDKEINNNTRNLIWKITPKEASNFIHKELFEIKILKLLPYLNKNFWIHSILSNNTKKKYISETKINDVKCFSKINNKYIKKIKENHISETEVNDIKCSYKINNNYSLNKLYKNIELILDTSSFLL